MPASSRRHFDTEPDSTAGPFAPERTGVVRAVKSDVPPVALVVEYAWRGPSDSYATTKLEAVRRRVDGLLRSLELGLVTGVRMEARCMQVCCAVHDGAEAARLITTDLAGSGFADFRRIGPPEG